MTGQRSPCGDGPPASNTVRKAHKFLVLEMTVECVETQLGKKKKKT